MRKLIRGFARDSIIRDKAKAVPVQIMSPCIRSREAATLCTKPGGRCVLLQMQGSVEESVLLHAHVDSLARAAPPTSSTMLHFATAFNGPSAFVLIIAAPQDRM